MGRPPIIPEQESEILELRSEGLGERVIAARTGLSKTVVHNRVSEAEALPTAVVAPAEPLPVRGGKAGWLDRGDVEREARSGRARERPANSFLEPREYLQHQIQLACVDGDRERLEAEERVLFEWEASADAGAG